MRLRAVSVSRDGLEIAGMQSRVPDDTGPESIALELSVSYDGTRTSNNCDGALQESALIDHLQVYGCDKDYRGGFVGELVASDADGSVTIDMACSFDVERDFDGDGQPGIEHQTLSGTLTLR